MSSLSLLRLAKRLAAAREGVTAVEFALIAPVLMLVVMGSLEFMLVMYAQSVMAYAAYNGSRLGKTGFANNGQSRLASIVTLIDQETAGILDPSQITVTSSSYGQWGQVSPGNPGVSGLGNAGNIVVYTFTYPWNIYTPIMQNILGTNGVYTITARAVVQNEPF